MKDYKSSNEKITVDEDLIYKTIDKLNNKKKTFMPQVLLLKRLVAGAAAMVILSFSSVAAYAAITKDARILQFFGIKISENYEKEAVETDVIIEENKNKILMKSFAIDNSYIVMEYEVTLNKNMEKQLPKLNISEISIFSPYIDKEQKENAKYKELSNYIPFEFEIEQVSEQIDEKQYRIFVIAHIKDINEKYREFTPHFDVGLVDSLSAYSHDLLEYSYGKYHDTVNYYYSSDVAKFKIVIENLDCNADSDLFKNEVIDLEINRKELPEREECKWEFYTKNVNYEYSYSENGDFKFYDWNIDNKLKATGDVLRGSFANIINVYIYEQEEYANATDIDKIEILIKNKNGEKIEPKHTYKYIYEDIFGAKNIEYTFIIDEEYEGEQYTIELDLIK